MNKVILSGRLTREPEVRYSTGENGVMIARYTMAVDRKHDRERQSADFINCVAFGRAAEFAKKYFRQGIKINIDLIRFLQDEKEIRSVKAVLPAVFWTSESNRCYILLQSYV